MYTLENYDPMLAFSKPPLPEFHFFNGEVTIYFDDDEHSYTRYGGDGLVKIDGVTTVVHIIDKSAALTQWAANQSVEYVQAKIDIALAEHMSMNQIATEELARESYRFAPAEIESWLNDARFNFRAYADAAADTGSIAHDWLEKYVKAQLKAGEHGQIQSQEVLEMLMNLPEDERARNGVLAALDWEWKHNVRWIATEKKIYSLQWDYAGTMDGLAFVDSCKDLNCCPHESKDELAVIDWKTSNRLYDEYRYQTAAYMQAQIEELGLPITGRWLTRLGKEESEFECWHLDYETFDLDWETFKNCLALERSVNKVKQRDKDKRAAEKAEVKEKKDLAKAAEKVRAAEVRNAVKAAKAADKAATKEADNLRKTKEKAEAKAAKDAAKAAEKAAKAAERAAKKASKA